MGKRVKRCSRANNGFLGRERPLEVEGQMLELRCLAKAGGSDSVAVVRCDGRRGMSRVAERTGTAEGPLIPQTRSLKLSVPWFTPL